MPRHLPYMRCWLSTEKLGSSVVVTYTILLYLPYLLWVMAILISHWPSFSSRDSTYSE